MKKRLLSGLAAIAAVGLFGVTGAAATVVPTPSGTSFVVNNGPGDQTNPHVSGNLVSYTDLATVPGSTVIRYHNIATGADAAIPLLAAGSTDDLSDVDGSRIVYTQTTPTTSAIMLFDAGTPGIMPVELSPQAGSARNEASIGGNTVAWQDFGFSPTGLSADIMAYDLSTKATSRLTSDANLLNQLPAVSAGGSVIVWLKCQVDLTGCNVWQATLSGTAWATKALTSDGIEAHADTNGAVVVYSRNGDVFEQPVGGGPEQSLTASIGGSSGNPSISGDVVSFEHTPANTTQTDIWATDLNTGTAFPVTNTASSSERLTDISVASGVVNVVWVVNGAGEDVLGFQYSLVTFNVCVLYDQTKAVQSGSTIPITLELCDANGANLSSAALVLHATGVVQLSTSTSGQVEAAGNANPDSDFRFDSGLAVGGGYIFNLKTTGLATGTYALTFTVSGDPVAHSVQFQVR